MLDYRKETVSSINETIVRFSKSEEVREQVVNGLAAIAVWHSIKDGQVTPAQNLVVAVRGKQKEQIVSYLTKFGNIKWSEKNGIQYNKGKTKEQYGLEKADEVWEKLPELDEAFPPAPRQYHDMPFMASIKHILERAEEVRKAGKTIVFANEQEKVLFEEMKALAALAA